MADISKAVLITGCSTGIGRATAEHLASNGWNVYATARKPETIQDLDAKGCKLLALDVCDESSMQSAVAAVEQAEGSVGVLVNNAGYSQSGAVESVPLDQVRRQFETNVFGLVRMQLVLARNAPAAGKDREHQLHGRQADLPRRRLLPRHQARGRGDLGRFALGGAWFRHRCRGNRAGPHQDPLRRHRSRVDRRVRAEEGPYAEFNEAVATATAGIYEGPMAKLGAGPEAVAKKIEKAISSRRPKTRYPVTASARLALTQRKLLTDRMWDRVLASQFPPS